MPTMLQPAPLPSSRSTRRRRRAMVVGAVAGVALLVPVGFGITEAVDRWMPDPPAAQTVDRSPAALLLAMRDVADYHAASGTYQVLVDVEQDSLYLPSMISGERSTLFATGTVDGRVDFSGLGPDAIRVSDDRRSATITLPAPTLTPATLDPAQTRIVGRERGLVQRVEDAVSDNPRDDSELYKLAAAKLDAAAAQSDLTTRAADNTRAMLPEERRRHSWRRVATPAGATARCRATICMDG